MKTIILWIGLFLNFWASFCLLGGPDGRLRSIDSIVIGLICVLLSLVCIKISTSGLRKPILMYIPIVSTLLVWTIALYVGYKIGFTVWLTLLPLSTIGAVIYYIMWLYRRD